MLNVSRQVCFSDVDSVRFATGDARMGDERAQRLDEALSSLVDSLIPTLPDEDEATADERHDDALDLARSIIEGYVTPQHRV